MIQNIPQIIEQSAKRFPNKDAFRCRDEAITYAELDKRANQLAQRLLAQGLAQGDRVGIYMQKRLECAVAIYGIQKAGGAYVPLDPAAPIARINFILRDCNIRQLISEDGKVNIVRKLAEQENDLTYVIGVTQPEEMDRASSSLHFVSWEEVFCGQSSAPVVDIAPTDLAYIIYTSGSTGIPKGIMHTHASGLAYARMAADLYELHSEDRLSNFPPLHFDQSTFDYFSGPLVGATTIIIPEEYQLIPASLSQLMETEQLTIWYSVPFALIQLLLRGVIEERNLRSLRWVIYGGEPFPLKHLKALMDLWPWATFSNNFGPAETNQCSYYNIPRLTEQDVIENKSIPIGYICAGMEARIVDERDAVVPRGDVGELLIHSPTTMHGYWNQPERNATAFYIATDSDNDSDAGQRYYRTGDLVRYRDDGLLEFLGRKDRQIKSRGYRIELDEIEAALLSHADVQEMAVFPVPDADGDTLIKAAVILKPGSSTSVNDLQKYAAAHLPRYAVPASIDIAEDFPRTTSGKIDRRALQAQSSS